MKQLIFSFAFIVYSILAFGQQNTEDKLVSELSRIQIAVSQAFKEKDYVKLEKLLFEQKDIYNFFETSIAFNFWQALNENNEYFPLPVNFTGGEMYLMNNDGKPVKLSYMIQRRYDPFSEDETQKELGYLKNDMFQSLTPPIRKGSTVTMETIKN
jgi:hypothetical protein